jgi:hypothetical protein
MDNSNNTIPSHGQQDFDNSRIHGKTFLYVSVNPSTNLPIMEIKLHVFAEGVNLRIEYTEVEHGSGEMTTRGKLENK